jgi:hypothetical protein
LLIGALFADQRSAAADELVSAISKKGSRGTASSELAEASGTSREEWLTRPAKNSGSASPRAESRASLETPIAFPAGA